MLLSASIVLFVSVSVPASVASVPVADGNVMVILLAILAGHINVAVLDQLSVSSANANEAAQLADAVVNALDKVSRSAHRACTELHMSVSVNTVQEALGKVNVLLVVAILLKSKIEFLVELPNTNNQSERYSVVESSSISKNAQDDVLLAIRTHHEAPVPFPSHQDM